MSGFDIARLALTAVTGGVGLLCIFANWQIMLGLGKAMRRAREERRSVSVVPFFGGVAGGAAMLLVPWPPANDLFWLPALIDPGCALLLLGPVVMLFRAVEPRHPPEVTPTPERQRAIAGCIIGTAVGDALGLVCEGLSPQRQRRLFPDLERYRFVAGRGMCSDDTEHTCMLAQSLIVTGGCVDIDHHAKQFASSFAWRLRFWLLALPAGVGFATARALLKLWLFIPPRHSGVFSAGNGPAMRSALLGVCYGDDPPRLRALVRAATRITHTDPKAEYAALAVAVAAHLASLGRAASFHEELPKWLDGGGEELLLLTRKIREQPSTEEFARSIGCANGVTGYAYHTVPVALHAWLAHPGDFHAAVLAAIRCGGDTDSVAAIVGAIAGAGVGKAGIPEAWLERLCEWPRSITWMDNLAARLAAVRASGYAQPELPLPAAMLLARNLFFLVLVLFHGFRRLAPPY